MYEKNPILGKHPSREAIDLYFGAWHGINTLAYIYLPEKYKPWWFIGILAVEVPVVYNNYRQGLTFTLSY